MKPTYKIEFRTSLNKKYAFEYTIQAQNAIQAIIKLQNFASTYPTYGTVTKIIRITQLT